MAGNASNIKASQAYVTIRADQGNLPTEIEKARASMKGFAAQVGSIGERVGGKFSEAIAKGAIGFAAVSAADSILRDLAKEMEAQADAGGIDFGGLGVAMVKSLRDTFEGLPLIGAIVPLSEQLWDALLGSPMATERRLEKIAQERERLQAALNDVAKQVARYDDEYTTKGDASLGARAAAFESAAEAVERLVKAGMSADKARESAAEIVSAFERLTSAKAAEAVADINYQLDVMSGSVPEAAQELRRFEKDLERIQRMFEAAGQSPESAKAETSALLGRFKDIQAGKAAEADLKREADRLGEINRLVDSLREKLLDANVDDSLRIELELGDLGATREQIDEAKAILDQIAALDDERKAMEDASRRNQKVAEIIKGLQDDSDRAAIGERGMLERELQSLMATQGEIDRALSLFDSANGASVETSFMGTFSPAALDGGFQGTGLEESSKQTARNTKRIADAVASGGQLTYGS